MLKAQTPALRLLLACARAHPTPQDESAIRQLLAEGVDWTDFAQEALRHGLAPLAGYTLDRAAPDLVPEEIRSAFGTIVERTAEQNRASFDQLADIVDALASGGVEAIAYRGPVLALQAFDAIGLCVFKDLELFVREQDIATTIGTLRRLGYDRKEQPDAQPEPTQGLHGHERLYNPALEIDVVLRTRLAPPQMAIDMRYAELWTRAQRTRLNGRSMRTLSVEDNLIALALHGGGEISRNMKWICDFAASIRSQAELDWDAMIARARAQNCLSLLLTATCLARTYFGATVPETIAVAERSDPTIAPIVSSTIARWADKPVRRSVNFFGSDPENLADPEMLFPAPDIFPYKIDVSRNTLSFVQMSRETFQKSSFLDRRMVRSGPGFFYADLARLLPNLPADRAEHPSHYILHGAHCGSTLLTRYLEQLPHCFVLREPTLLGQLASVKIDASNSAVLEPQHWSDWFKVTMALLSRTYPTDKAVIIKAADLCNWMGDILLDHDQRTKIVFLMSPLKDFLISGLKSESRRGWTRKRIQALRGCLAQVPFLAKSAAMELSDGQARAAIWLYNNFLCGSMLARPDGDRVLALNSKSFFAGQQEMLNRVANFLDLTHDDAVRAALASFSPLSYHAKDSQLAYDEAKRTAINNNVELRFRQEVEAALSWAKQTLAGSDLQMPVALE